MIITSCRLLAIKAYSNISYKLSTPGRHVTYHGLCVVESNTARQSTLGEQTQLRDDELVKLWSCQYNSVLLDFAPV